MTIAYILFAIIITILFILAIKSFTSNTNDAKLDAFITASNEKLNSINNDVKRIEDAVRKEISLNRIETSNESKRARDELSESLQSFKQDLSQTIQQFNTIQKDNFFELLRKQSDQNTDTSTKLDTMRNTIEQKVSAMQTSNEQKLEQMRITVDEKLQQTLEARLGESFKLVSERLEAVHKGLGDMQTLATGVGDLKRVLSNVKTRGVLGEYQLEAILEQILTPDQYAKNVKTKLGSNALVEFAVNWQMQLSGIAK